MGKERRADEPTPYPARNLARPHRRRAIETADHAPAPEYMTVEEYAARIRVTPATVRRMVREENLPHVRPRRRLIRIKVNEADRWIADRNSGTLARRSAIIHARRGAA